MNAVVPRLSCTPTAISNSFQPSYRFPSISSIANLRGSARLRAAARRILDDSDLVEKAMPAGRCPAERRKDGRLIAEGRCRAAPSSVLDQSAFSIWWRFATRPVARRPDSPLPPPEALSARSSSSAGSFLRLVLADHRRMPGSAVGFVLGRRFGEGGLGGLQADLCMASRTDSRSSALSIASGGWLRSS